VQTFTGTFTVANLSTALPLQFSIEHTSHLKVSPVRGRLEGSDSPPHNLATISFTMETSSFGLYQERIMVHNENNAGQSNEVLVTVFASDQTLVTDLPRVEPALATAGRMVGAAVLRCEGIYVIHSGTPFSTDSSPSKEKASSPTPSASPATATATATGTDLSLSRATSAEHSSFQAPLQLQQRGDVEEEEEELKCVPYWGVFTLFNKRPEEVRLVPKSDLGIWVSFDGGGAIDEGGGGGGGGEEELLRMNDFVVTSPYTVCGPRTLLRPFQSCLVRVKFTYPAHLSEDDRVLLEKGRKVPFRGTLLFERLSSDLSPRLEKLESAVAKRVDVMGSYCMSVGRVMQPVVSLGRIGYANRWSEVEFSVDVANYSDQPLLYRIGTLPSPISFLSNKTSTSASSAPLSPQPLSLPRFVQHTRVDSVGSPIPEPTDMDGNILEDEWVDGDETEGKRRVETGATDTLRFVLATSQLQEAVPKMYAWNVVLANLNNPGNTMVTVVEAQLTAPTFSFRGVSERNVILPQLTVPAPDGSPPSDEALAIVNVSGEAVEVDLPSPVITPTLSSIIQLDILSVSTNAPIKSALLRPSEALELRIRARPLPAATRIPEGTSLSPDTVQLATLFVASAGNPTEAIYVMSPLKQGPTFSLSPSRLTLTHRRSVLHLTNPSPASPVSLTFTPSTPLLRVSECGPIPPLASCDVSVYVDEDAPSARSFTGSVTLTISDALTPSAPVVTCPVTIPPRIDEHLDEHPSVQRLASLQMSPPPPACPSSSSTSIVPSSSLLTSTSLSRKDVPSSSSSSGGATALAVSVALSSSEQQRPIMALRGCTPVSASNNRFVINVGQQSLGSGNVDWSMRVENLSATAPCNYVLYALTEDDRSWLTLPRGLSGTLSPTESHPLLLTFSTANMGVYSTHLILENRDNPFDLKTIRVSMEVVANSNIMPRSPGQRDGPSTYFSVLVDGRRTEKPSVPVIDLADVYYNFLYRNRSFVIVNSHTAPLDFMLGCNVDRLDASEFNFSLSNTSLKRVQNLTVDGKASVRVYIHFRPCLPPAPPLLAQTSEDRDIDQCTVEQKEITITCRLVKDYQEVVVFRANCRRPQMELSTTDLVFIGRDTAVSSSLSSVSSSPALSSPPTPTDAIYEPQPQPQPAIPDRLLKKRDSETYVLEIEPEAHTLSIRNLHSRPLRYTLRNDSLFFTVQCGDSPNEKDVGQVYHVVVRPNMSAILEKLNQILKDKYVEEHFSVYNCNNLTEKYWVSVRLSTGHLRHFSTSPGPKTAYPFQSLEHTISRFLRSFNRFWADQQQAIVEGAGAGAEEEYMQLYVELHYITDELVFYGLKGQVGQFVFHLATLLYSVLFRHPVFSSFFATSSVQSSSSSPPTLPSAPWASSRPTSTSYVDVFQPPLSKWVGQLSHFLSFHPDRRDDILPLRRLETLLRGSPSSLVGSPSLFSELPS